MTGAMAFLKKEFQEILRTYKIYVIPTVFLAMGILSPILAKITPDLVKSLAKGITVIIPPPVARDAYLQLFKNFNQLIILAVIFSLIGLVADEKVKGSAILILTKPVPKWSFILSKYAASAVLILVSTCLSYLACLYYTVLIFKEALFAASAQAVLLVMAFYLLILAITLLASTINRSVALAGAISVGAFLVLMVLPSFGAWLARYSPAALIDYENRLLQGTATIAAAAPALAITLGLATALVFLAVWIFKHQEL